MNYRTLFYRSSSVLVLMLLALGCNEKDDGSYVPPITRYEKIAGTWKLNSLIQSDEIAKSTGGTLKEMNLTNKFNFKDLRISFYTDEDFNPTSYEVTGDVPELFLKSGFWTLDSPFTTGKVAKLYLYADEARVQLIDELDVVTVPGATNVLELKLTRSSSGTPFLSYLYSLRPDNG